MMENRELDKIKYEAAREHVAKIRKFGVNVLVFCIVFIFFNRENIFQLNEFNFGFGRVSIIFWIWGIILAVKAVNLFVFDYDWERKMIERNLKNNSNGKL